MPTQTSKSATGLGPAVKAADANFTGKPVGGAVNACAVHWVAVSLRAEPNLSRRPGWWPPTKETAYNRVPYPYEPFEADTPAGKKSGSLDPYGAVTFMNIPAGTCRFQFKKFYEEIDKFFDEALK